MSEVEQKTELILPVPPLQNRLGNRPMPSKQPTAYDKAVNDAVRMMHDHAGIRKGRQKI